MSNFIRVSILVGLCAVMGCKALGVMFQTNRQRRLAYIEANPDTPAQNDILSGLIRIGMTAPQVRASWGSPIDVNRTVGSWGVHEQWVYGSHYVYFEDGILTSFQD